MALFWNKKASTDNSNDGTLKRALRNIAFPTYTCNHCGYHVSRNTRVCPQCKSLLRGVKCGWCDEVYDSDLEQCPNCGTSNAPVVSSESTCCVCQRNLSSTRPNSDIDDVARYCMNCGSDICVQCLQKLERSRDEMKPICPHCRKAVSFELSS